MNTRNYPANCAPATRNAQHPFHLLNELFGAQEFSHVVPSVNIVETADSFRIELAAPGLSREDFSLNLEKQVLTVKGSREKSLAEGEKYSLREYSFHKFERAFRLPATVDAEKISARYDQGILSVTLPKKDVAVEKPVRSIVIE